MSKKRKRKNWHQKESLMTLDEILEAVRQEVLTATSKYGPFNSAHEGYAVLQEEVDELWDEIKANRGYSSEANDEAKQIAAMAVRYMMDVSSPS